MKANEVKQVCKQAFDELIEAVEAGKSEQLIQYLKVMGRFHRYSLGNQFLIFSQKKEAEQVAGFWTWKKSGRSVKKGAKGIAIMAPIVYRGKTHSEAILANEKEENDLEIVRSFKVCYVFDISDTDGEDLPCFSTVKGDPGLYLDRLKDYIASKGIKLEFKHLYGTTQGYSAGGLIALKSGLSPAQQMSVLLHEAAHEFLHRDQGIKELDKKVVEVEAEAVSYVVCQGVGLDVNTAHSDYLQLYDGNQKMLMQSLKRIQMIASETLHAITQKAVMEVMVKAA
ncbi:MAG: DUF1738 domain-containing protein [Planctomycetes bacterium]|nr:DUF1738 domain-containing protein [Planctomycetota bacterium]